MAQDTLFIRLRADGQMDWLLQGDAGPPASGHADDPDALAAPDSGLPADMSRIVLIVPGSDVLVRAVELPARSVAQARAALPWLLEDDMAAAPDSQHVGLSQPDDAGRRLAVAASRAKMDEWSGALAAAGLTADHILPDFALLGERPGDAVIVAGDDMVLFSPGDASGGGACEPELARRLLPTLLTDSSCRRIDLYGGDEELADALPETCGISCKPALMNDDLLALLARNFMARQGWPDLAQGVYAPRRERAFSRGRLRRLALLAAALLVAHAATVILEMQRFADRAAAAEQRMEDVFRQVAPEGSRIVNPRVQLANIKAQLGGQGGDFIDLSRKLHRAVSATPGVVLRALTYDRRTRALRVEAELRDFNDIEALKSHLQDQGAVLENSGVRQSEGGILGEFTLREASS